MTEEANVVTQFSHSIKISDTAKAKKAESDRKYYQKMKARYLKYKGKRIRVTKEKKGVCEWCGAKKGIDVKQTQLHHLKYDENNPSLYTVELCASCHRKETVKQQGPEKIREIAKIGRSHLTKEDCSKGGKIGNLGRKWVYNTGTKQLQPRRTFNFVK